MVDIALGIAIYSYVIFGLGLAGFLYKIPVLIITGIFLGTLFYWLNKNYKINFSWIRRIKEDKIILFSVILLIVQVFINFLGAISPELSFDALWYHLPPAKIFAENHRISFIPGNLLWAANSPHLVDNFYTAALVISNEVLAKLIHFSFGLLSAIAFFNLLKRYFNLRISVLGVLIFYTMLIVGWLSTTAYIDLGRTFFEILALDYFLKWFEEKDKEFFILSALFVGLAISSKILAFGSLFTFLLLIFYLSKTSKIKNLLTYSSFALIPVIPWFVFSFVNSGNPFFPLFGNLKDQSSPSFSISIFTAFDYLSNLFFLPWRLVTQTLKPDDIISPLFLILIPLLILLINKEKIVFKIVFAYLILALSFTIPNINRYILPYIPAFTFLVLMVFNSKIIENKLLKSFIYILIFSSVILNLGSRILATRKFIPYLLKQESKNEFLTKNLNFDYGDFYDIDGYFAKNINKDDRVLVYGIHNLYYLNFPFVHESMAKKGIGFTHLLVGNNEPLPERFRDKILIYENNTTNVKLYLLGEQF